MNENERYEKLIFDTLFHKFHKKGSMLNKAATFILCITTVVLLILLHLSTRKIEKLQIDIKIAQNNSSMHHNNWFACEGILRSSK